MVVKNGKRLCGSGGAITNVPIIQNKAYFEVKIQSNGLNFPLIYFIIEGQTLIN